MRRWKVTRSWYVDADTYRGALDGARDPAQAAEVDAFVVEQKVDGAQLLAEYEATHGVITQDEIDALRE